VTGRWPRRLRRGDTVAVVAPAGPVRPDALHHAVSVLTSWGLHVRVADSARTTHRTLGYLAAPDAQRADEFTDAWLDPDVAAVFAARGGYGCQRMLDLIDWSALAATGPTLFAGSSDVTALHQAIATHLNCVSLFSPMPATTAFDTPAAEHLQRPLFHPDTTTVLTATGATTLMPGRASGPVTGGNLSLLAAGLGAPEHQHAAGTIVLLEDVSEDAYRIVRMLTQLLRAGYFTGVTGIAIGSWTECGPPEHVRSVLLDRLAPLGVPMVCNLDFGHHPGALTVPLNAETELDADTATLTFTEPVLAP
jgi:muramoyltetrapeptide carboxypeptidase